MCSMPLILGDFAHLNLNDRQDLYICLLHFHQHTCCHIVSTGCRETNVEERSRVGDGWVRTPMLDLCSFVVDPGLVSRLFLSAAYVVHYIWGPLCIIHFFCFYYFPVLFPCCVGPNRISSTSQFQSSKSQLIHAAMCRAALTPMFSVIFYPFVDDGTKILRCSFPTA